MTKKFELKVGDRTLTIEHGKLAQKAAGAVTLQYGETVVLATVVFSDEIRDEIDYFPLMVDYEEKLYAAGKIKGSRFIKREGRPSDESVLRGRLIDRAIRPLFPQHIQNDVQVIIEVLSYDDENEASVLGLVAASCAISISKIPFNGPVSAVRVGLIDGEYVLNPTISAMEKSSLDLIVASTDNKVVMVEAGAKEVEWDKVEGAMEFSKKYTKEINEFISKIQAEIGEEKLEIPQEEIEPEVEKKVETFAKDKILEILFGKTTKKIERKKEIKNLGKEVKKNLGEEFEGKEAQISKAYIELVERIVRDKILDEDVRIGERALDEIRDISIEVGILPRPHGTGYFMRGETQVVTVTTLGAPGEEQIIDGLEDEYKKRYIHHYNFPPFSVGEARPLRGPSRRDIGHGSLAEKALMPVIPDKEEFPYTIRLVSEVFGSNGSSSMASSCGSTLALMDAGVPIKAPVAGIAMGIASRSDDEYKILTDIQDLEDTEGGMDFKITATRNGITALQMDTKTLGLTSKMVHDTFTQGKKAVLELIEKIEKVIPEPRKDLSPHAPRIHKLQINPEKIREVIGPGGKVINEIIEKTGVEIDIEDSGLVFITSEDKAGAEKAIAMVNQIAREPKVGEVYEGKVVKIVDFGAFVEIWPGQEALLHVSQIADKRIENVRDHLKEGQKVKVRCLEIDDRGRASLSMRNLDQEK